MAKSTNQQLPLILNQDKINSGKICQHTDPKSIDDFIGSLINTVSNSYHYHTLANLLTPAHTSCLRNFKITMIQSYLKSKCYLRKRLAQAYRRILDTRFKKNSLWFDYEWTLLVICLSHKHISRKLDPHQRYKRFTLSCSVDGQLLAVDLISDYKKGQWKINRELLRRQLYHLRVTKNIRITLNQTIPKLQKDIRQAQRKGTLPRLLQLPWVKENLLNPQNLLSFGKKKLKLSKLANLGIDTSNHQINSSPTLRLRLANIRSLSKEKLLTDRATESLLSTFPDVYIYTETKRDPSDEYLLRHRQVFHSCAEEGRGGTTFLVRKEINVAYSDTEIPDTVILILQVDKATVILVGTYLTHRGKDKCQKLNLILEVTNKLAERYIHPTILIFGDFNMNEHSLRYNLNKQKHLLADLKLNIASNYTSPPNFPPLSTRRGINKNNITKFSRLDYIITNSNCSIRTEFVETISDHIFFNVTLNLKHSSMRRVLSYDRNKINRELNTLLKEDINSILTFIKTNLHSYKKVRIPKLEKRKCLEFQISPYRKHLLNNWINDFNSFANSITSLRFSAFQGLAFGKLRTITKYNQFQKRDGSIIKTLKDTSGTIVTNSEEVDKALMNHLRQNDNRFTDRTYMTWNQIPTLPIPSPNELVNVLQKVSQHKALTHFPVPDEFAHQLLAHNRYSAIINLWNPETLERFPEIFDSKLVPLNKVHPEIPKVSQMRPIVATNVLFKILELRFSDELHRKFWNLKGFALSQFGFLRGMNTQAQIYNLLNQVTQGWIHLPGKKLHFHELSLDPRLPKYNPLHHYVIFIDFKEAYNSINMGLLYEMMKKDEILEDNKLIFLFTIYSKLKIRLGKESFTPKNGVPQGGINSPILFNFAMFYFLTEAASTINSRVLQLSGLPNAQGIMKPENNFLWADDLASLIKAHPNRAKDFIKIYFEALIESGHKWGLSINFNKSAIMDFFSLKTSYNHLSDYPTEWTKGKGALLKLDLYPNGTLTTVSIPLVTEYKYLGVIITRDLLPNSHLQTLRKKINYLTNAFRSVGGASQSLKFCVNTWHVFIRPLLDYSQTYFSFLQDRHRKSLNSLYRESARKMTFLRRYTPNCLVDKLIQYNYKELHLEFYRVAKNKTQRRNSDFDNRPFPSERIDFGYRKIDLTNVPIKWVKIWNLFYYPNGSQNIPQTLRDLLDDLQINDISTFMHKFLVTSFSQDDLIILNKIHSALLSTLGD